MRFAASCLSVGAIALSFLACNRSAPPKASTDVVLPSATSAARTAPDADGERCARGYTRLFGGLKKEMQITAYLSRGTPELDKLADHITALLERYRAASNGKLVVRTVVPKTAAERKAALDAGLVEGLLGESGDGDSVTISKGFVGIVFEYGADKDVIKQIATANKDGIEFWITNKIREVRDRAEGTKHRIGVLTGHDEVRIDEPSLVPSNMGRPNLQQVITQNFPFYAFEQVDLQRGERVVDPSLDGLLVTQPAKDLSDKELRRIDAFLTSGKSVVVIVGAANLQPFDATMQATLDHHGVDRLLRGYGLELGNDVLLDVGSSFRVAVETQTGAANARFPTMLRIDGAEQARLDRTFAPFFLLNEVVVPFASSITLHEEKQPGATFRVVARSSPHTIALTGKTLDLRPFQAWKPKGTEAEFVVGVSLTGPISSAFAEGPAKAPAAGAPKSRLFVLASSQFLVNPFARAANPPDIGETTAMMMPSGDETLTQLAAPYAQTALTNTILSFKNTLDWISGDEDLVACAHPGKPQVTSSPAR